MKEVTFHCDVCRDMVADKDGTKRAFIGYEFESNSVGHTSRLRTANPPDCFRHVCLPCLRGFAVLAEKHCGEM